MDVFVGDRSVVHAKVPPEKAYTRREGVPGAVTRLQAQRAHQHVFRAEADFDVSIARFARVSRQGKRASHTVASFVEDVGKNHGRADVSMTQ